MRVIELTRGLVAIVDDEDFEALAQWRWCALTSGYANRKARMAEGNVGKSILMHRVIMNAKKDEHVDHINGIVTDNRKCNLRICNRFQNQSNRGKNKNNTTGFKGVCFENRSKKFLATISSNGKCKRLGLFNTAEEAHAAYCEAASKFHGEFAKFN